MNAKLYILLPTHNRRSITEKFIDCLSVQVFTNFHLILIDDGSKDGTSEMVRARVSNVTVLYGNGNWWWAGSLHHGINWLKDNASMRDKVLIINDDVIFGADFLQNGVELLDKLGGMLLPQVLNRSTGEIEESGVEVNFKTLTFKTASSPEKINCLPTRGLFMHMQTLIITGNFHPKLLPHYLSDYEYTIRAYKKNIKLSTSPKLLINFDESTSGYRSFDGLSIAEFFSRYFSKKSTTNPFYWIAFIFLASPKYFIPLHVTKVLISTTKAIIKNVYSHV